MILSFGFATLLAAASGLGVYLYRSKRSEVADRFLLAATPLLTVALLVGVATTSLNSRMFEWNNARLAPAASLAYGYQLYYPATSGPVLDHIYTPVSAIVYLPTTLATHPDVAVVTGTLISTLLFLTPVIVVSLGASRGSASNNWQLVLLIVFGCWAFARLVPSLNYAMTTIHADAPALGFAGLACFYAMRAPRRLKPGSRLSFDVFLCCLFATLSFWSKQTMVPLLVAIPVWLLIAIGWRRAVGSALLLLVMSLAALALVSLYVPLEAFFFNIFEIPRQHPWTGSYGQLCREFFRLEQSLIWLCVVPILVIAIWSTRSAGRRLWQLRRLCRENPWTLFFLVGLLTIPTCVLTKVKVGGGANAFAPAMYVFLLANAWILARSWSFQRPIPIGDCGKRMGTAFAVLLAIVVSQEVGWQLRQAQVRSYTAAAFDYLSANPDSAYFPWHPLAHLMAKGRLCHFDYGLYDRRIAGHSVDQSHLLAGIPTKANLLCLPPLHYTKLHDSALRKMFPHRVEIENLPGWECYERRP